MTSPRSRGWCPPRQYLRHCTCQHCLAKRHETGMPTMSRSSLRLDSRRNHVFFSLRNPGMLSNFQPALSTFTRPTAFRGTYRLGQVERGCPAPMRISFFSHIISNHHKEIRLDMQISVTETRQSSRLSSQTAESNTDAEVGHGHTRL